jgi:hypothetical protein
MKLLLSIMIVIAACSGGEHRDARDKYNDGVAALEGQKYEDAEKAFTQAIDDAGVDPELRVKAAYDLGVALAQHAKSVDGAQPRDADKELQLLHEAAGWFQDSIRLASAADKPEAQANLAIVMARAQALADEVNKGENGLQPRLEKLITGQRKVRDDVQKVWDDVVAAGAQGDPTAQRGAYETGATAERALLADAGTIGDMADDEISAIGAKAQDQRTDEEKARLIQLQNLDQYLQQARTAQSDARRQLHGLDGDQARRSTEAALEALKRAREQLLDPITVLREIAREQLELAQATDRAAQSDRDAHKLDRALGANAAKPLLVSERPAALGERQGHVKERIDEVAARLAAGAEHEDQAKDDKEKQLLAHVKAALPSVREASDAMGRAQSDLAGGRSEEALADERAALVALAHAIEQFSDLKQLIDLTWADQGTVDQLIASPPAELAPDERAREVEDRVARNLDRLGRMESMIKNEVAKADQPAPQGAQALDPKQIEAMKAQLAEAETLRGQAVAAEQALSAALAAPGGDPKPSSKETLDKVTELRKLFFSLIEHLQQLIRDQGDTRDQTATARGADDEARAAALPALVGRQAEHAQLGQEIADALAKQADAAQQQQQQPQQGAQQQGPDPKALADATDEMKQAVTSMQGASTGLGDAQKEAQTASVDLQPTLDDQQKALEHLENALRLLQPPPKQNQGDKNDKDKQQQQQQQQQQQKKQQDDASAQEAQRRAQQVRDNEQKREEKRREQQRSQPEPVDEDW